MTDLDTIRERARKHFLYHREAAALESAYAELEARLQREQRAADAESEELSLQINTLKARLRTLEDTLREAKEQTYCQICGAALAAAETPAAR